MDTGLFEKYKKVISKKEEDKEIVIRSIQEVSGVHLTKDEIILEKKKILLQTSSVKKSIILTSKNKKALQEKGYYL